jgi:ABC-2 type transport system permease protein
LAAGLYRAPLRAVGYGIASPSIRIASFISKELRVVLRQRVLLGSLVLGPFLILLAFGATFQGRQPQLRTTLVVPNDPTVRGWVQAYEQKGSPGFKIVGETSSLDEAEAAVMRGESDVALVVPSDVTQRLRDHQQVNLQIVNDLVDPSQRDWLGYNTYVLTTELNHRAQAEVIQSLNRPDIPSDFLVSPFTSEPVDLADVKPSYVAFYAPGVLALLLQHLAITLGALSLVRERRTGSVELFRVAPVSSLEILIGKALGYAALLLVTGGVLAALAWRFLGVPYLGPLESLGATAVALIFASLGIGFAISALSGSELQAAQLTMLTLLASVFFSGFFVPLATFATPALAIADVLPVSWGVVALQELMLRGQAPGSIVYIALGAIGAITFAVAITRFHRQLRLD